MPPGSPHAVEPANNPNPRQIREDRVGASGFRRLRNSIENSVDAIEVTT
jgi:hypothetical protein